MKNRTGTDRIDGMKKILTLSVLLVVCASVFAAPSLSELFPKLSEENLAELRSGKTLEAYTNKGDRIADISPLGSLGRSTALTGDRLYKGFCVAALSFIPYPEKYLSMTDEQRSVELFNILRSISTQKGLQYISHLAGDKPQVLFQDSYMISNPDDKNSRIADPVSDSVPSEYSCWCMQKDNRFGKNVYSLKYTIKDGDFLMNINNYTAMKYMGFTCVDKGILNMYLEVLETDEGFVLYTMAVVRDQEPEVNILFISVDLTSSFMRRITALKEWFTARVNE